MSGRGVRVGTRILAGTERELRVGVPFGAGSDLASG